MDGGEKLLPGAEERLRVRWVPSVLLDLPPAEPLLALRTPHRVMLQAVPTTRQGLAALLGRAPFEIAVDLETDAAPLRHAPVHEVHEVRLAADLPLDWGAYYWLCDGLLDDLTENAADPAAGFLRGRMRLAIAEQVLRELPRGARCDLAELDAAWAAPHAMPAPDSERWGEPSQALQQYVRGFAGHLVEHAASQSFVEEARKLAQLAEERNDPSLPNLSSTEVRALSLYAHHRLFGSPHLAAPAGMIAGWHLLFSAHVVAVWWTGLLGGPKRTARSKDAVLSALALLDQGLWGDEPLVHDVLRHLNASEYTSLGLAASLATALRGAAVRA